MKKIIFAILIGTLILSSQINNNANAQAFQKNEFTLTLDVVGSSMFSINNGDYSPGFGSAYSWISSLNGGLNIHGEWAIHNYVSLGFIAGLQGGNYGSHSGIGYYYDGYVKDDYRMLSLPIGIKADFHFYQLISDKTGKNIHADKLDIYAGMNIGSGFSVVFKPGWFNALFFVGPQAGIRYYFSDRIGVNLEVGYGKSFISGGLVFKM